MNPKVEFLLFMDWVLIQMKLSGNGPSEKCVKRAEDMIDKLRKRK